MTTSSPTAAPAATGQDACPLWCTEHHSYTSDPDDNWHATGYQPAADAIINMNTGTIAGDIRIFGLHDLGHDAPGGESISLEQAEQVAFLLLGFVAAARSGAER